jgi:acetylornithine deacetylase
MDSEQLVDLARRLVAAPSPTGHEAPAARVAEELLRDAGLDVQRQPVGAGDRFNVLASHGRPRAILCTHLDTVPGTLPIEVRDGVLHGRGACDAKGPAAAMIVAAAELRSRGLTDFGVLFVVGEETTSDGAITAAERLADDRARWPLESILIGEPTGGAFVSAHPGVVMASLTTMGRAAHSSTPELGVSATHLMLDWLAAIRAEPWPACERLGPTKLNVGRIGGGIAPNVVAEEASADVMVRTGATPEAIVSRIRQLAPPRSTVDVTCASQPARFEPFGDEPSIAAAFASDAPFLATLGRLWLMGPGEIGHAHADDEQVSGAALALAARRYAEWLTSRLARGAR